MENEDVDHPTNHLEKLRDVDLTDQEEDTTNKLCINSVNGSGATPSFFARQIPLFNLGIIRAQAYKVCCTQSPKNAVVRTSLSQRDLWK